MEVPFFEERTSTLFDCVTVTMAYDESFLEFDVVPISVSDDGRTRRDPENGRPTRAAMRWKDFEGYCEDLTGRLLGRAVR